MSQASLLGLPPSLRSRIYDNLLEDASFRLPDRPDYDDTCDYPDHLPSSGKGVHNVWAYLEICRTMRDEVKPLFFSETAFMIDETTWDFDRWLETIGPEAIGQLRRITIRCEGRCREQTHNFDDPLFEPGDDKCERIISIDRSKYKSWTKSKPNGTKCNKYCGVHNPICWGRTEEYFKEALADLPKEGRPRKLTLEGLTHIRESISENNSRYA